MTTPSEREYAVYRRGEVREMILRNFREGLRSRRDPKTGQLITEDTIRLTTAKGGRWWREAEADDLIVMGAQKSNEFLAQQMRIDRAGTEYLDGYHGPLWGESKLPAFGGSGTVRARGLAGVTWPGSTTVPDSFAVYARDAQSNRFQVLVTGVADDDGEVELTLVGIDGGTVTNIDVGAELRWVNPPGGSEPIAVVIDEKFRGGADAETDAAFAARLASRIRHKPASANWAHLRAFARAASVSVEDAFVYTCAFHAGSELVAITQKRDAPGPLGRLPSESVLSAVTLALVPPSSAFVPGRAHVVVVPPQLESSNAVVRLAQPFGSVAGWTDVEPFPPINGSAAVEVVLISTQQDFRILTSAPGLLPNGASSATDVNMMVWHPATSAFVALEVTTVTDLGGGAYRVQLADAPAGHTLAVGDWVSPDMSRRAALAEAVTAYFDTLGPGEVINLQTDTRAPRAFRNPVPNEEYPQRAGQSIVSTITEALGAPVGDAQLTAISVATPTLPSDVVDGPNLIVAGKFAVYALT